MATHDYVISNASGAAVRADLNNALAAIVTNNSSATAPTTTYAYQWWADTGSSPAVMKLRNAANSAWITLFQLDGEWSTLALENGTAAAPSIYFKDSGTDTGFFSPGADQVAITTGGSQRVTVSTTGVTSTLPVDVALGSVTAPTYTFTGDLNTGIWSPAADTIAFSEGGSEAMRIDSSSRLLVGTSSARGNFFNTTAASDLQVENGNGIASVIRNANDIYAPAFVLAKSRSSSNTIIQSGDTVGMVSFQGNDGSEFVETARIESVVDGTPGANDMPGRLVFSTTRDGQASPTQAFIIDKDQALLFTTSTSFYGSNGWYGTSINSQVGSISIARNGSNVMAFFHTSNSSGINGTPVGTISITTTATSYNTSSDYRLKENVTAVADGITRLQQLKPSRFNFIADPSKTVDGFIAHEVQEVVPEAITGEKDAVDDDGNPVYQGIDQSKLVPLLTAALQELVAEVESLKAEVAALKAQ